MADIFTNLPVPTGANGSGTAVDVSATGANKYILCDGAWTLPDRPPTTNVEMSNEASPTGWSPLCTFVGNGIRRVTCAARWMRVTISNYRGGTNPAVNFGSTDDVADFVNLAVSAGDGTGAAVDVSSLGEIKTLQVAGTFTGAVIMEYSEDAGGVDWAECQAMYAPGSYTIPLIAMWARIRRQGIPTNGPAGTPICNLGGVAPSGSGGGTAVFTRIAVQDLALTPALTPAALTGSNNDYGPAGFDTYTRIRQATSDGTVTITGMDAQVDGELRLIENIGPNSLAFTNEDASSLAPNRVITPGGTTLTILTGGAAWFVYDEIDSRWHTDSATGVSGSDGLLGVQQFTATGVYTPTPGTRRVKYYASAPGGGGGGTAATAATECAVGGGGAPGAYISDWVYGGGGLITGGPVTMGAPGAGGAAGNNPGAAGGDLTFTIQSVLYTAKGGGGGSGSANKSTAAAIVNPGGQVPAGTTAASVLVLNSGFDGIAGFSLNGGGGGGSTPLGSGAPSVTNAAGAVATGHGGGGGGANAGSAGVAARAGGAGLVGILIIEEYAS